jgi:NAD(P)H-nitrite reductase large subunit
MAVQLDEQGGAALRKKITALGVQVHTSKATRKSWRMATACAELCRWWS